MNFELKHDPNFSRYFNLPHHDSVPNLSHLERVRAFIRELRHNVLALVWVVSVLLCIYQVLFDLTALIIALFPPIISYFILSEFCIIDPRQTLLLVPIVIILTFWLIILARNQRKGSGIDSATAEIIIEMKNVFPKSWTNHY